MPAANISANDSDTPIAMNELQNDDFLFWNENQIFPDFLPTSSRFLLNFFPIFQIHSPGISQQ